MPTEEEDDYIFFIFFMCFFIMCFFIMGFFIIAPSAGAVASGAGAAVLPAGGAAFGSVCAIATPKLRIEAAQARTRVFLIDIE